MTRKHLRVEVSRSCTPCINSTKKLKRSCPSAHADRPPHFCLDRCPQDSAKGDYRDLKKAGILGKGKGNVMKVILTAVTNYRAWIFFLTYGYSFGVELVVDNIIVTYFYDQFELNLVTGG